MQRFLTAFLVSLVLALVAYFLAVEYVDKEATWRAVKRLTVGGWAVVLACSLLNYLLRFLRWEYYITHLSASVIPRLRHLAIYCAGFTLTTTPGKAGEAVRSYYLHPHGVSYPQSLSALFVERVVDLLAVVLLSALALVAVGTGSVYALVGLGLVFVIVGLIRSGAVLWLVEWIACRLPGKFAALAQHVAQMLRSSSVLLQNRVFYASLLVGLVSWGVEGFGFYIILKYLTVDVSWAMATSIYAIALLAGALSFIPGGLGAAELVSVALLLAIGVPEPEAVAATLICRVATLWFAVFLGMAPLGWLTVHRLSDLPVPSGREAVREARDE